MRSILLLVLLYTKRIIFLLLGGIVFIRVASHLLHPFLYHLCTKHLKLGSLSTLHESHWWVGLIYAGSELLMVFVDVWHPCFLLIIRHLILCDYRRVCESTWSGRRWLVNDLQESTRKLRKPAAPRHFLLLWNVWLWNALIFATLYICSHTQFGNTNSVFALWFECSVNSDAVVKFQRKSLWFALQINRIAKVAQYAILLSVCESLDCVVKANWKCWKLDFSTEPCSRRVWTVRKLLMGWFKHPTWLKIQTCVVEVNWYLVGNVYWPVVD